MKRAFAKPLKRTAGLLLCAAMLISLAACGSSTSVDKLRQDSAQFTSERPTSEGAVHTVAADSLKNIASSGLVELLIDEGSAAVCVRDTSHNKLWTSLPEQENSEAAVAQLTVQNNGTTYILNTQDNAVAYGSVSINKRDDGVTVTYILASEKDMVLKSSYGETDIVFSLEINYTLADGSLYITSAVKNLVDPSDAKVCELKMLEYFGAYSQAQAGDYIFVPDGSGAIIKTDSTALNFDSELSFDVYGSDPSASNSAKSNPAVVPAYGMKQGESAFLILVEEGDALARITADTVRDGNDFFKVGVGFTLTPNVMEEGGTKSTSYLSQSSHSDDTALCIRFLNGSNANYAGMAAACREQLIRDRVLSTKTVQQTEYLPLNLSIIGVANDPIIEIGSFSLSVNKTYTDFEQAQDMILRMKAKGINGISVRYKGALSGGVNQSNIAGASLLRRLGSGSDLDELLSYISAQNMEMYLDIDLISSSERGSFSSSRSAENIFGSRSEFDSVNGLYPFIGKNAYTKRLLGISNVENAVVRVLSNSGFSGFTGFCINDVGSVLYSDFAAGYDRQAAADAVSEQLPPLSAGRKLMTDTGNFYMLKDVEFVSNIPIEPSVEESEFYEGVPFVQLILHGIVDYSSEPINLSTDAQNSMLRAIEYGACPSYEWSYTDPDEGDGSRGVYYEDWLNSAADYYTKANAALADLRSSRMVAHGEIQPGVYRTEYDSGAIVYVNYSEEAVVTSGITVPAQDFLRIN